jgi:hypothetical protein
VQRRVVRTTPQPRPADCFALIGPNEMDTQTLKDAFYFAGSVLGIVAFMRTLLDPMSERNRRRWEEVKSRVDEADFQDLEADVDQRRRIEDRTRQKLITS